MAGKIYVAKQNGVIGTKDGLVRLRAGVTRVREGHELLNGNEHLFEEQHVDYDTEDATQRPADGDRSLSGKNLADYQQRGGAERKTKRHDSPGLTPDGEKAEEDPVDLSEQTPELAHQQKNAEEAAKISDERDIPMPSGDNDTAASNEQTAEEKATEDKAREESAEAMKAAEAEGQADQENAEAAAKVADKPTPQPRKRGPRKPPGLTSGDVKPTPGA
jgi:hypothetical protein